ncbi:uncharacterized protein LOC131956135 [Physella acuta]|uniref:uncharacterized protein LOC131956135 n=1 Tax=Physella acuta TaxID=109671 RepID=UPI0027DB8824|nr:uncharacterized protein LOC131956135 [Physella acuta]
MYIFLLASLTIAMVVASQTGTKEEQVLRAVVEGVNTIQSQKCLETKLENCSTEFTAAKDEKTDLNIQCGLANTYLTCLKNQHCIINEEIKPCATTRKKRQADDSQVVKKNAVDAILALTCKTEACTFNKTSVMLSTTKELVCKNMETYGECLNNACKDNEDLAKNITRINAICNGSGHFQITFFAVSFASLLHAFIQN